MAARALVVDDDRKKLASILSILNDAGIDRLAIDVAQTGSEARRYLTSVRYDLVIVDIALPMRPEDAPDRRGGIRLLDEITERECYKLPLSLVDLTAFEDLHEEFGGYFRSKLWTLDQYQQTDKGWMDRLKAKARYAIARADQREAACFETDVCVIAALQSPELTALRSIKWDWHEPRSFDEVGYFYEGKFVSGERPKSVIAAAAPRMGMVATAVLSSKIITKFRPRLLFMVGICAGVKPNAAIGDVLIADPSWDWQMGRYARGGFQVSPDHIDIPTGIAERFLQLGRNQQFWFDVHKDYVGPKPSNIPVLRVGPVTSGSGVLADSRLLAGIRAQHRKLLGVEMELYGMYAAARDSAPPSPMAIGVKSVCDYADSKKDDGYQGYAAYVSARAFAAFCEQNADDIINAPK